MLAAASGPGAASLRPETWGLSVASPASAWGTLGGFPGHLLGLGTGDMDEPSGVCWG